MKHLHTIIAVSLGISLYAQHKVAPKQTESILIQNATAHLGNGKIIENALIGFENGKINLITNNAQTDITNYKIKIDASGKHVYPGFIAPNSTLGLVEIDAIKASNDENEIGAINPNVKSLIAYNAESRVIETVKPNGVLIAQVTPRGGRISGTSSIVQLDSWSWQDAVIKENDGIHLNFPRTYSTSGWWAEPSNIEPNKDYTKQVAEISTFLNNAKAYNKGGNNEKNIIFESAIGLFNGSQTLFIHADESMQIKDAVTLTLNNGIKKMVIVGGYEAYKSTDLLKTNNIPVLLQRVHSIPKNNDDPIDLPYRLAKILTDNGILVGLENSGDMERMNTRNLPFLAGTCAAYGMDKEQALQLITGNTAKILGIDNTCGTLELGKDATLFISEGDALDMKTNKLTQAFIQGRTIDLNNHQSKLNAIYKQKYAQE